MRKSIFLLLLSLVTRQLSAQTRTVHLQGVVQDTAAKSIVLIHPADATLARWENTTLPVLNRAFDTSIQIPFPVEVSIRNGNRVYTKLFLSGDAKILVDAAGEPHVAGSPMQEEYEKEFSPFFQESDRLRDSLRTWYSDAYQKYGQDLPPSIKDSINLLSGKLYGQRARLLSEYIRQHPDSYVALWEIEYLIAKPTAHPYVDFEKLFSSFSKQVQQQPFIHTLREKVSGAARMQAGQAFPEAFFKGDEQLRSKLRKQNRYYLIDFWFSHCAPCAREFPKLKELYSRFHRKGFDIVSISTDKQKDKLDYVMAIEKYQLRWNHVWDQDGVKADQFNIHAFPTYVLLDQDGRIINPDIRAGELEAFLEEHLGGQ